MAKLPFQAAHPLRYSSVNNFLAFVSSPGAESFRSRNLLEHLMRVADFLSEQHVPFEMLLHPPAFTAQNRAKFLHLPGRQVAKSVLLKGPGGYLLAILPATRHIDPELLSEALGGPVRLATDREITDVFPDCEWGVVPPFGRLYGLPVVLDDSLAPDAWMVFEGNSHAEALRLHCRDYEYLEKPRRLRFAD
jgi:Ala-tRNA(Pro) deacylase